MRFCCSRVSDAGQSSRLFAGDRGSRLFAVDRIRRFVAAGHYSRFLGTELVQRLVQRLVQLLVQRFDFGETLSIFVKLQDLAFLRRRYLVRNTATVDDTNFFKIKDREAAPHLFWPKAHDFMHLISALIFIACVKI